MAASYPSSVKSFSAVTNGVTKLVASLFNSPYDEITAVETELGTDVAGTAADLKTRLAVFLNNDGTSKVDCDDYGTKLSSPTAKTLENVKFQWGYVTIGAGTSVSITGLPYTATTSYIGVATLAKAGQSDDSPAVNQVSNTQMDIYNSSGSTEVINWMTIGS